MAFFTVGAGVVSTGRVTGGNILLGDLQDRLGLGFMLLQNFFRPVRVSVEYIARDPDGCSTQDQGYVIALAEQTA